ncbi:transposase domain-containing protein [Mesorhizobium sp. M0698]|uniref:transposase domain-containing protein n=1 Tax=Mesorhizobium sp. M0698 TaxID=2956987 RepID=UPI00333923BE
MNQVDPHAWLTQTLERIANGWPNRVSRRSCLGTTIAERHQLPAYGRRSRL